VLENFRYERFDTTDEDIFAAARLAHADGFIRCLQQGCDFTISERGEGLFRGQG
jgi:ABC-type multidrug transport system fused ATPase/permease subunit